jgi:hypothetical protein
MALVRATNPAMLKPGPDGFTVDFESLQGKKALTSDELLLTKLRVAMEPATDAPAATPSLEIDATEGQRLASVLARLEKLQPWPADVLALSGALRKRLSAFL